MQIKHYVLELTTLFSLQTIRRPSTENGQTTTGSDSRCTVRYTYVGSQSANEW